MKTKIKCHGDEVTDFYDKKIPKVDSNCTSLAVISLRSALKQRQKILFTSFSSSGESDESESDEE